MALTKKKIGQHFESLLQKYEQSNEMSNYILYYQISGHLNGPANFNAANIDIKSKRTEVESIW